MGERAEEGATTTDTFLTERADRSYTYNHDGQTIVIERIPQGVAYARNGNAHNPTRYYVWQAYLNGTVVPIKRETRREAWEAAVWKHCRNIEAAPALRSWWDSEALMRAELVKP